MKLFKRTGTGQDYVFTVLDGLMVRMASDEVYDEYIIIRGGMENGR